MKFTLRDLFWLVVVAAIAMGWYVHHRETMRMVRSRAPMLYEAMTGEEITAEEINTNNVKK
ncbi:hypothetical protein [Anatilimnocola floriformis]|uniref:hypothetical protein n=1 Tax=Anatilimnocola floriformis TaxID=2948575 RepID=UPI0020C46D6F|nr:hypothetical protein [Anatilimnocola floriformis]